MQKTITTLSTVLLNEKFYENKEQSVINYSL